MAAKLLQVNFKFKVSAAEFEQTALALASQFAALPGLRWKVWFINEAEREAGGIYLFDDEGSLNAYLTGPLAAGMLSYPAFSDFSLKQSDVMEGLTAITRGPVEAGAQA